MSYKLPLKVLVIEFEEHLNVALCNTLERNFFDVIRSYSSEQALKSVVDNIINIAIISSRLNDISAVEMAVRLRKTNALVKIPIVFILNDGETASNYNYVDNGLIGLLHRPFTPSQLISLVKSLLRRSNPIFQDKVIRYKDVSLDLSTYKVFRNKIQIHLGPTEFKILQLFIQNPKAILSRQNIIDHVWRADKSIEHRTIDVHINRLRTMMKIGNNEEPFIKTVRSSGYCINLPGEID